MMKKLFVFVILCLCFNSCYEIDYGYPMIRSINDSRPPEYRGVLKLRLVDADKNWSKSVDADKLKLVCIDQEYLPSENAVSLSRNADSSLESISLNLRAISDYRIFKLKRNKDVEDKIIAIYKDPSEGWGAILTMIVYNGKEYKIEEINLEDGDRKEGQEAVPIDILVE